MLIQTTLNKVRVKVEKTIRRHRLRIFGESISNSELLKQFDISAHKPLNVKETSKHLAHRKKPKFFPGLRSPKDITPLIEEHYPHIKEDIIRDADLVRKHVFEFLGSGKISLGTKINWHVDFKTGYLWDPQKYYRNAEIPYEKADIKVPWELSRFQHLSSLGQAYWLTGHEKYAEEYVNQVSDWIESNPAQLGVNWTCTMDVAIRVINWILGYYFFKDSKVIGDYFSVKFLKSLLVHGRYIMANLENWGPITTNHYLSDIVGLVYLGVMFPEFKEAKKWRNFGIQELKKEMGKQVYPDGCDFEASTCYHRLVLELFFFSTLLVVINDDKFNGEDYREICEETFGRSYTDKLYRMFEVVLYALKPNGQMPQIGDNDNGRLHIFSRQATLDMRYLLTLGAVFFEDPKLKLKEFDLCEDALWIFGKKGYKTWQNLDGNQLGNVGSRAHPYAGWYVMRSNRDYMIISSGPNGQGGNGGHCHNDKLSFELCINGEDFIIDPGTYVYTSEPKMRNLFRSTRYHNTVVIDGEEQNGFDERSLFMMSDDSKARCFRWESSDEQDLFIAAHSGYERLNDPIVHRRVIGFSKKEVRWEIRDEFYRVDSGVKQSGSKTHGPSHLFDWYFHLAPQVVVEQIEENELLFKGTKGVVNFGISGVPSGYNLVIEHDWFSPQYGEKVRCKLLKIECKQRVPFQVKFKIKRLA